MLYGASAFYCYSIMRSIYNFGMNFIFIVTVILLLVIVHRLAGKKLNRYELVRKARSPLNKSGDLL